MTLHRWVLAATFLTCVSSATQQAAAQSYNTSRYGRAEAYAAARQPTRPAPQPTTAYRYEPLNTQTPEPRQHYVQYPAQARKPAARLESQFTQTQYSPPVPPQQQQQSAGFRPYTPPPPAPSYQPQPAYQQQAYAPPPSPSSYPAPASSGQREPYSSYGPRGGFGQGQASWGGDIFNQQDWRLALGLGFGFIPKYDGSDDQRAIPFPYFDVSYKNRIFLNALRGFGINIYDSDSVHFSSALGYRMGRDSKDFPLGADIDPAFELSFLGYYYVPVGPGKLRLGAQLAGDISGVHEGFIGEFGVGYVTSATQQLDLVFELSTSLASEDYMATYFYTDSTSIKDIGASVYGIYSIDQHWAWHTLASYEILMGDAKDSIVARTGSENMITFGTAIVYNF